MSDTDPCKRASPECSDEEMKDSDDGSISQYSSPDSMSHTRPEGRNTPRSKGTADQTPNGSPKESLDGHSYEECEVHDDSCFLPGDTFTGKNPAPTYRRHNFRRIIMSGQTLVIPGNADCQSRVAMIHARYPKYKGNYRKLRRNWTNRSAFDDSTSRHQVDLRPLLRN